MWTDPGFSLLLWAFTDKRPHHPSGLTPPSSDGRVLPPLECAQILQSHYAFSNGSSRPPQIMAFFTGPTQWLFLSKDITRKPFFVNTALPENTALSQLQAVHVLLIFWLTQTQNIELETSGQTCPIIRTTAAEREWVTSFQELIAIHPGATPYL